MFLDYNGLQKYNVLINNKINNLSDNNGNIPVSSIFWLAATIIPKGFLLCDGSALKRNIYAELFSVIGTTFGAGDGSTTFNLPDLRAAFIRGAGTVTYESRTHIAEFGKKQASTYLSNQVKQIGNYLYNYCKIDKTDDEKTYSPQKYVTVDYGPYGECTNALNATCGASRPYNVALTPIIKY